MHRADRLADPTQILVLPLELESRGVYDRNQPGTLASEVIPSVVPWQKNSYSTSLDRITMGSTAIDTALLSVAGAIGGGFVDSFGIYLGRAPDGVHHELSANALWPPTIGTVSSNVKSCQKTPALETGHGHQLAVREKHHVFRHALTIVHDASDETILNPRRIWRRLSLYAIWQFVRGQIDFASSGSLVLGRHPAHSFPLGQTPMMAVSCLWDWFKPEDCQIVGPYALCYSDGSVCSIGSRVSCQSRFKNDRINRNEARYTAGSRAAHDR